MRNTVKVTVAAVVLALTLALGGVSFAKEAKGACGFGCKMKCSIAATQCGMKCKKDAGCKSKCESTKSACQGNKPPVKK